MPVTKICKPILCALQHQTAKTSVDRCACITQQDLEEYNGQVSEMGDIYRGSAETFIYPGEQDESSELVFEMIETYRRQEGRVIGVCCLNKMAKI